MKQTWLNRHETSLPDEVCVIQIKLQGDPKIHGYPEVLTGFWIPRDPEEYREGALPHGGFLGTFRDNLTKLGFHAWQQNDSEFVEYRVIPKRPNKPPLQKPSLPF